MECTLLLAKKEVEKDECLLDVNTELEDQAEMPDQKLVAEIATSLISQYLVKVKYFEKSFIRISMIQGGTNRDFSGDNLCGAVVGALGGCCWGTLGLRKLCF